MSQIAVIEIENNTIDLNEIKNKTFDSKISFNIDNLMKLNFFKDGNTYISIVNDLEAKELDMLIFDYEIDLRDYKKIFNTISPLFKSVMYLVENNIKPKNIKLFISEDCNVDSDDFIKINIDFLNIEKSFIDYVSAHNTITTNCFPPIVFDFI